MSVPSSQGSHVDVTPKMGGRCDVCGCCLFLDLGQTYCTGCERDRVRRASLERAENIVELYRAGESLQKIGRRYSGMTRERVRQILSSVGVDRRSGGPWLLARRKMALKEKERQSISDQYWLKKCGMTWNELLKISPRARVLFGQKRKNAWQSGIAWELTLAEWWQKWQESGKWEQSGRGWDKYVMCRVANSGPFNIKNIRICKFQEILKK